MRVSRRDHVDRGARPPIAHRGNGQVSQALLDLEDIQRIGVARVVGRPRHQPTGVCRQLELRVARVLQRSVTKEDRVLGLHVVVRIHADLDGLHLAVIDEAGGEILLLLRQLVAVPQRVLVVTRDPRNEERHARIRELRGFQVGLVVARDNVVAARIRGELQGVAGRGRRDRRQTIDFAQPEVELREFVRERLQQALLLRREVAGRRQPRQHATDDVLEVDGDHVAHVAVDRRAERLAFEHRAHRSRCRGAGRRRRDRNLIDLADRNLDVLTAVGARLNGVQRRLDQRIDTPDAALVRRHRVRVACRCAARQLADQQLRVARDAEVLDAVAVQWQRGAEVHRRAQLSERILDDPKLAADVHRLGRQTTTELRRRHRGVRAQALGIRHVEHRAPIRIVVSVVVVRNDGVLHALIGHQDGTLRALDVQSIERDVVARLGHGDGRHLRARDCVGRGVPGDRQREQAAVVIVGTGHEETVWIRGRGHGADPGAAAVGRQGGDRDHGARSVADIQLAQIQHENIARRKAADTVLHMNLRNAHHQGHAVGAQGHACDAVVRRGHLRAGNRGVRVRRACRIWTDVVDQQLESLAAVVVAFADEQDVPGHRQGRDVLVAGHPYRLHQLEGDRVDDINRTNAADVDARLVSRERDRLVLGSEDVGTVKGAAGLLRLIDERRVADGRVLEDEIDTRARHHDCRIVARLDLERIAFIDAARIDERTPFGRQPGTGRNAARDLPLHAADSDLGGEVERDQPVGTAGSGVDDLGRAVAEHRSDDDLAGDRSRIGVADLELHLARRRIDGRGRDGRRGDAGRRWRRGQRVRKDDLVDLSRRIRRQDHGHHEVRELRNAECVGAGTQSCRARRQQTDDVGVRFGDLCGHAAIHAAELDPLVGAHLHVDRRGGESRQSRADDIVAGRHNARQRRAGGSGNAVGTDEAVVDQPPGGLRRSVGHHHLAATEDRDFFPWLRIRLQRDCQLQRIGRIVLANVQMEGRDGVEHALRRRRAHLGREIGQVDARDSDVGVMCQRAGADHHRFTRGGLDGSAGIGGHLDRDGQARTRVGLNELRRLDQQRHVGLRRKLLDQGIAGDVSVAVVVRLVFLAEVDDADRDLAFA